jgi:hypothetical protein
MLKTQHKQLLGSLLLAFELSILLLHVAGNNSEQNCKYTNVLKVLTLIKNFGS